MKEYIRGLLKSLRDPSKSRLIVREYLQARILDALQESGAFVSWAFIGGTALRFLRVSCMRFFHADIIKEEMYMISFGTFLIHPGRGPI